MTEKEVAAFLLKEVDAAGVETSWERELCPSVFTGPESAGAHAGPTDRKIEKGHVLNIDFGTRSERYCSDLQRTWYFLQRRRTEGARGGDARLRDDRRCDRARRREDPPGNGGEGDRCPRARIHRRQGVRRVPACPGPPGRAEDARRGRAPLPRVGALRNPTVPQGRGEPGLHPRAAHHHSRATAWRPRRRSSWFEGTGENFCRARSRRSF